MPSSTARCALLRSALTVFVVQLGTAAAQTAAGECGSAAIAVGSYTSVSWIPEASGEGVTLLDLELCNCLLYTSPSPRD